MKKRKLFCERLEPRHMLTAGAIDTAFGDDGWAEEAWTQDQQSPDNVSDMLTDADGRVWVLGTTYFGHGRSPVVARYTPSGDLDTSFSDDGFTTVPWGSMGDGVSELALQSDGRVILAGSGSANSVNSYGYLAISRLNTDGSLDTTFGDEGKAVLPVGSDVAYYSSASAIAVDSQDRILAVGRNVRNGAILTRFTSNGQLDESFGENGIVFLASDIDSASGLVVMSDDGVVIAARADHFAQGVGLVRYDDTGQLDVDFGTSGFAELDGPENIGQLNARGFYISLEIALDAEGRIVLANNRIHEEVGRYVIARFDAMGQLDSTFGDNGITVVPRPSESVYGIDLAVRPDNSIAFSSHIYSSTERRYLVQAFSLLADGNLDLDFSQSGAWQTPISVTPLSGFAVASSANGTLVAASIDGAQLYESDFHLFQLDETGANVSEFGTDGQVVTNFATSLINTIPETIVALDDGRAIVLAVNGSERFLLRYDVEGKLDLSYGDQGRLALPERSFLALGESTNGDSNNYVMYTQYNNHPDPPTSYFRKLSATGELVPMTPDEPWQLFAYRDWMNAIDNVVPTPDGGLLVLGTGDRTGSSTGETYSMVRVSDDGVVDESYGDNGIVTIPQRLASGEGIRACFSPDGTTTVLIGNPVQRLFGVDLQRFLPDGSPDLSFGFLGRRLTTFDTAFSADNDRNLICTDDGGVVTLGVHRISQPYAWSQVVVERYDSSGDPVQDFAGDGVVELQLGDHSTQPRGIAVDGKGRILVAADADSSHQFDMTVVRLLEDGQVDTSYGENGRFDFSLGGFNESIRSIDLAVNGDLLVTGQTHDGLHTRMLSTRLQGDREVPVTWRNEAMPEDVNGDRAITALDVLTLISNLNLRGSRSLPALKLDGLLGGYLDVNGDGLVSPLDALFVVSRINRGIGGESEPLISIPWGDDDDWWMKFHRV